MTSRIQRTYLALVAVSVLVGVGLFTEQFKAVYALPPGDTFSVINQNDSGAGSLRQAVIDANTNGNPSEQDIIEFNISGTGDKEIVTESTITITEPVLIDGYTQTGAEENTADWPEPFNGVVRVEIYQDISDGGIVVNASDTTLRGLAINLSPTVEVEVNEADNFVLEGSFIGIDGIGYGLRKNANNTGGVVVNDSDNIRIGGGLAAERNVMGYCMRSCIEVSGTSGNTSASPVIQGNYVGVGIDSLTPMESATIGGTGIRLNRYVDDPLIGGDSGTEGNTIASNTHGAIWAFDIDNMQIQGNRIYGNKNYGSNGAGVEIGAGIHLEGVTNSTVGGSGAARNIIAGNRDGSLYISDSTDTSAQSTNIEIINNYLGVMDDGTTPYPNTQSNIVIKDNTEYVRIESNVIKNAAVLPVQTYLDGIALSGTSDNISIIGNSIYNHPNAGIDLSADGPTSNDDGDTDSGVNSLLNYPTYYEVTESGGDTIINYSYNGPGGDYRIEFFANTDADIPGPGEGETYIGYDEITKPDNNMTYHSVTVDGTGHENISLTATEIDNGSPTGYGSSSEFGGVGDPPPPIIDIVTEKRLLNPEDATVGNTVEYEITIRNDGPDSINIEDYDNSIPGANQLFIDILPPEAEYISGSGTNISCFAGPPGSASLYGPSLGDHSDYQLVFCGWNGGSNVLDAGEEITAIITAQVVDDTEPNFKNYVTGFIQEYDPDYELALAAFTSGNDILTTYESLAGNAYNNAYWTDTTLADTSVSKTLENSDEILSGDTVNYDLTFSNAGPNPADLTYYDGSGFNPVLTSLFIDVLPTNLDFVESSNPDVPCVLVGPSSLAPYFLDHPDYNLIVCAYAGSETELIAGQSISTTISAVATEDIDEGLTNFALTGLNEEDPDYLFNYYHLGSAAGTFFGNDRGLGDYLTRMSSSNRNFAQAIYALDEPEEPGGGNGNGNGNNNGNGTDSDGLAETGQAIIIAILLGIIIIVSAVTLYRRSRPVYTA